MSFEAMAWAVKHKLPSKQKIVILMLANRTNGDTGRCDPSHKRLAEDCGLSVSSVKRAISDLEQAGILRVIERHSGEVQLPNQYLLNLDWVGSHGTGGSVQCEPGVGSHRPTKQEYNQEDKPSCDQQADSRQRIPYSEIFDAYAESLPELPQLKLKDAARKRSIKTVWDLDEKFQTTDFFARYFAHVSKSDFLMGRNDAAWKGCCFDWLMKPANLKKIIEGNYHHA